MNNIGAVHPNCVIFYKHHFYNIKYQYNPFNFLIELFFLLCYDFINRITGGNFMSKKKLFKHISLFMSVLFVLQAFAMPSYAFDKMPLTQEQWQNRYESLVTSNTLPLLCVGSDETELNITWHADKNAAYPEVKLSEKADMSGAVMFTGEAVPAENDEQLVCRVTMTGIEENTTYYYQYHSEKGWSKSAKYESKAFDSYKMLVVGDIQIGGQTTDNPDEQSRIGYVWQSVLDEALTQNPDISFLLSPGDNISTGKSADEWQTLMMPTYVPSLPMALAIGNHDKKGFSYNYYTNMPNEFYGKYFEGLDRDFWFRYGDVLYLVFDATSGSAADHRAMAAEAVAANPDAKWRIATMHQALYGAGYSMLDPETTILLNGVFQPIFDMYNVDLVLTGHSHLQGRSKFIENGLIVGAAKSGKTYKNPIGRIYLNSNACCDQGGAGSSIFSAYNFKEGDTTTYTTIEFSGDSMAVKTFRGDNSELLDSITIVKTKEQKDSGFLIFLKRIPYALVELLGLVYMKIDNVVVKIRGGHF